MVVGGNRTWVLADSMAIAASALTTAPPRHYNYYALFRVVTIYHICLLFLLFLLCFCTLFSIRLA